MMNSPIPTPKMRTSTVTTNQSLKTTKKIRTIQSLKKSQSLMTTKKNMLDLEPGQRTLLRICTSHFTPLLAQTTSRLPGKKPSVPMTKRMSKCLIPTSSPSS
jgi:hypothetical protein